MSTSLVSNSSLKRRFASPYSTLTPIFSALTTVGSNSFTYPTSFTGGSVAVVALSCLAVGGGGGGGGGWTNFSNPGGGGGAGAVWTGVIYLSSGSSYTINVGQGGSGGGSQAAGQTGSATYINYPGVGTYLLYVGAGGGGGGGTNGTSNPNIAGGGSAGGAGGGTNRLYTCSNGLTGGSLSIYANQFTINRTDINPGWPTNTRISNGGSYTAQGGGGGGGGAMRYGSNAGGAGFSAGSGGRGFTFSFPRYFNRSSVDIGGGGGGGGDSGLGGFTGPGAGGFGGGGRGGDTNGSVAPEAGTANTGGGGGGGGGGSSNASGGAGGSGVVYIFGGELVYPGVKL